MTRSNSSFGTTVIAWLVVIVFGAALMFTTQAWAISRAEPTIAQYTVASADQYVSTATQPAEPSPRDQARALLDVHGGAEVAIQWTTDPTVNCGLLEAGATGGGCFRSSTPDTIYLSPGLTGDVLTYVVLHEFSHVQQWQRGDPLDECAADAQAIAWGADPTLAHYTECATEGGSR